MKIIAEPFWHNSNYVDIECRSVPLKSLETLRKVIDQERNFITSNVFLSMFDVKVDFLLGFSIYNQYV